MKIKLSFHAILLSVVLCAVSSMGYIDLYPYTPDPTNDFTPTLSWYVVSGGTNFRVQIDDDATFMTPLIDDYTSYTSYTPTADLPEGVIYWRVSDDWNYDYFSNS